MDILNRAEEIKDKLVFYRREIHTFAETGFQNAKTRSFVLKALREMGIEGRECGKGGISALIGEGDRVVLLRADMDALSIREETGLSFASQNGNMHACGHDMHTAMLLGAARLLKEREAELSGTVKLMLQPAEEILEGAKNMIENGILDSPKVDAAFMLHVNPISYKKAAVILSEGGLDAPAAAFFIIEINGKGCHGAEPQSGVDATLIGAHIIAAIDSLIAKELSFLNSAVATIGSAISNGAQNAVSDKMILKGTARSFDEKVLERVLQRIEEISKNIAAAFRGSAEFKVSSSCPTLKNDRGLMRLAEKGCVELFGRDAVLVSDKKGSASEDFSYISHMVPSAAISLCAGLGADYPLHHPRVDFSEDVLAGGSAALAHIAKKYLESRDEKR